MTRNTFLRKLKNYLKDIPASERDNIVEFYSEMFDDANISNDDEVPEHFGNPEKIAFEILSQDYGESVNSDNDTKWDSREKKRGFFKDISLIFLSIFSLPVLIPLLVLLIVGAVAFAVITVISALLIPFVTLILPFFYFKIFLYIVAFFIVIKIVSRIIKKIHRKFSRKKEKMNYKFNEYQTYYKNYYKNYNKTNSNEEFEQFKFQSIDDVNIEVNNFNVKFKKSDHDEVIVKYNSEQSKKIEISKNLNKLDIVLNGGGIGSKIKKSIEIFLPESVNINFEVNASTVRISNLDFKNFFAEINASEFELENVFLEKGDFEINASTVSGNLDYGKNIDLEVNASSIDFNFSRDEIFIYKTVSLCNISTAPKYIESSQNYTLYLEASVSNIKLK